MTRIKQDEQLIETIPGCGLCGPKMNSAARNYYALPALVPTSLYCVQNSFEIEAESFERFLAGYFVFVFQALNGPKP
jgi:hypothetical protein